ncbi:GtrA family protein [uncultured Aliiroseovarius sp.]|uniref:GtrA family protein n=1 Tax=uncultured Aliiroseovarius sp. TaxID=1658783 RepID=UPI002595A075|nr:GtrA family protein [uncultured Aliiroseovarius sp.]
MPAQLLRFIGVGGLATLTHVLVASLAYRYASVPDMWANFAGFCVAVLVSYTGHSRVTFATEPTQKGQFPRFVFVASMGLVASSTIVGVVSTWGGGSFYLAMALVVVLVPIATFLALRFWVFSDRAATALPPWPVVIIALIFSTVFMGLYWNWPVNHDTAWYLVATRKMLDGARLYVDIVEVNPPLNFYLTVPALWLADALHISDTNGQYLAVALLYLVSMVWSGAVLRRVTDLSPVRYYAFFIFMAIIYILGAGSEIAQREHLLVLFLSPWLIGNLSADKRTPSLASSVFAAIGICIKPFFLLFPLTFLARDIWRNRSIAPIIYPRYLAMLFVGVFYVAFVMTRHPEYLGDIAPMAVDVYGAFKKPMSEVLLDQLVPMTLGLLAMSVLLFQPNANANLFALAAFAGLISYFAQSTAFHYHLIPFLCYALLAAVMALLTSRINLVRTLPSYVFGGLLIFGLIQFGKHRNEMTDVVVSVAKKHGPITSLMAGSTLLDPGAPAALRLGVDWVSRYPHNWLYPGAISKLAQTDCNLHPMLCEKLTGFADRNRDGNLEDIVRHKPDLIVAMRDVGRLETASITWMTFMEADPRFVDVMKNYTLVHRTREMDFYLRNAE